MPKYLTLYELNKTRQLVLIQLEFIFNQPSFIISENAINEVSVGIIGLELALEACSPEQGQAPP